VRPPARDRPKKPLTADSLRWFALRYVERYATTEGKLVQYLRGKVRERGWAGEGTAPVEAEARRMVEAGYVDDRAFGEARARSMTRRGLGARRVTQTLAAAGIEAGVRDEIADGIDAVEAAVAFARKKRLGPYGPPAETPQARQKQVAAMLRAGHGFDVVKAVLGGIADED
jgi:regulatory protein